MPERYSQVRLVRLPISVGMPVSSLKLSSSRVRLVRLPISAGIAPVSSLKLSSSRVRLVRLPISAGIAPVSELSKSHSWVTEPLPSVVTPYQSATGAVVPQRKSRVQ